MFILLSPAKKLATITKPYSGDMTQPYFNEYSSVLIELMKSKTVTELVKLMSLSADLAKLNYDRYQQFFIDSVPVNACYPALFLFQGDVYKGLNAKDWSLEDLKYAQSTLRILSGLYGILRPLDAIQAYRLEMGVRLENPQGKTLYDYWGNAISQYINNELATSENPLLVNLASQEYFSVINLEKIHFQCIHINFYEQKNGICKIVGIHAKKARGVMTNYLIQKRITSIADLIRFNELGYFFDEKTSNQTNLNFVRVH